MDLLDLLRAVPLTLLVLGTESCGVSPDPPLVAHVVEFGVGRPSGSQRRTADSSSATGFITYGDAELESHTTVVPATRGAAFGVFYRLDGVPADRVLRLTQVIRHPPMKKPDGTVIHQQVSYEDVTSSDGHADGGLWYILREEYELVPGAWSVALLHGTTPLLKQEFTVAPPN